MPTQRPGTQDALIRVLILEDEPDAGEALALYAGRVPGFGVAGHVRTGGDALRRLAAGGVDLVLLDIGLPDMSGLEVLRRLRAAGQTVDVIATTRARDLSVVQAAVSFGVTQYLVKPFTSAAVRQKLERYAAYRASVTSADLPVAQGEIDSLFGALRPADETSGLPKGVSRDSLQLVVTTLREARQQDAGPARDDESAGARSAGELAGILGWSRVTVRRYLEHLVETGLAERQARYGGAGRPELEYRWVGAQHGRPSGTR